MAPATIAMSRKNKNKNKNNQGGGATQDPTAKNANNNANGKQVAQQKQQQAQKGQQKQQQQAQKGQQVAQQKQQQQAPQKQQKQQAVQKQQPNKQPQKKEQPAKQQQQQQAASGKKKQNVAEPEPEPEEEEEEDEEFSLEALMQWADSQGIEFDHDLVDIEVELPSDDQDEEEEEDEDEDEENDETKKSPSVRVVAKVEVPEGTVLATIPAKAILTCANSGIAEELAEEGIDMLICGLTLSLLHERLRGEDSPWYSYLHQNPLFPNRVRLPMLWTEEERRFLKGTDLESHLEEMLEMCLEDFDDIAYDFIKKHPEKFPGLVKAGEEPDRDELLTVFMAATTVVIAKRVELKGEEIGLVPLLELYSSVKPNVVFHVEEDDEEDELDEDEEEEEDDEDEEMPDLVEEEKVPKKKGGKNQKKQPVEKETEDDAEDGDEEEAEDTYDIIISEDVDEGEELCINPYGDRTTLDLLSQRLVTDPFVEEQSIESILAQIENEDDEDDEQEDSKKTKNSGKKKAAEGEDDEDAEEDDEDDGTIRYMPTNLYDTVVLGKQRIVRIVYSALEGRYGGNDKKVERHMSSRLEFWDGVCAEAVGEMMEDIEKEYEDDGEDGEDDGFIVDDEEDDDEDEE
ncbi:hypothetical protein HDU96_002135, partial [Phlyctochytrium bullatum]